MVVSRTIIPKKYKIAILLILSFLAIVYWILFDFLRQIEFDTSSFVGASRFMFNLDGGYNFQSRLSKPIVLLLPGLVELILGIHPKYMFLLQNGISYYLLGFIVFKSIFLITQNHKYALLGVIVYFMCQPFAVYSLFYLADTVGWLFGFYAIYLTIKAFYLQNVNNKEIMMISFIAGLGMLAKESAVVGIIFLLLFLTLSSNPIKLKIKYITLSIITFLIPFLISNVLTQKYYGVSVFQRILEQQSNEGFVFYNKTNFQQVFRIFDVYWILFAIGIWKVMKSFKQDILKKTVFTLLGTAGIALLIMPMYPFIVDRILFMIAPCLIVFVVIGSGVFEKFDYPVIIVGGIINVLMTWIIYRFNISGVLQIGFFLYLIMLATFIFLLKMNTLKGVSKELHAL